MKVFKPNDLALLYRTYTFAGRKTLSLGMLAMFPYSGGGRESLVQEPQLWGLTAQALAAIGIDAPLDEGWSKPASEYMVIGSAFAPGANKGAEVPQIAVTATLGGVTKQLYVFGDREFGLGGLPSAAQPFNRMPLGPAQAFGGAGFKDNPSGKGFVPMPGLDGRRRRALPNVEHPRQLMAAVSDEPMPAGFTALAPDHSVRKALLGKFDQRWTQQTWPHLPEETQMNYFMAAPPDQRMPGYLRGDEAFALDHLHPEWAHIEGRLPGLRARCFIERALASGGKEFVELQPRAETVWFLPEQERGIILYRAATQIQDSDGDDVTYALLEWEMLAESPLPFAHYEAQFRNQIAQAQAAAPIDVAPPISPVIPPTEIALPAAAVPAVAAVPALEPELLEIEKLTASLQAHTDAVLRRHGLSEADITRPAVEAPETSLAEIEALTEQMRAETQALLSRNGLTEADIIHPPTEPPTTSLEQLQLITSRMEADKAAFMQKHGVTDAQLQDWLLQQGQSDAAKFIGDVPKALAQQQVELDALQAAIAAAAALPVAAAAPTLPKLPDLPLLANEQAVKITREQVIERHAQGESLADLDLSGLDLSMLDLSGAIFSNALLTQTSFCKSQLERARFDGAVLQTADFTEADLRHAVLSGASADRSVFTTSQLEGGDLSKADFTGADFSAASLSGASLFQAVFADAAMDGLKAAGCQAMQASFAGASLQSADLSGAVLTAASFAGANGAGISLGRSMCDNADFHGAQMPGADFTGASLQGSRAGVGSVFDGGIFSAAQMTGASWEGASARSARFDQATLDQSDLSRLQAQDAIFAGASARGARLAKADLTGADLSAVNLFKGSLRKAKVERAVMHHANLYGVDVEEVKISRAALEGADTGQTLLQVRPPT